MKPRIEKPPSAPLPELGQRKVAEGAEVSGTPRVSAQEPPAAAPIGGGLAKTVFGAYAQQAKEIAELGAQLEGIEVRFSKVPGKLGALAKRVVDTLLEQEERPDWRGQSRAPSAADRQRTVVDTAYRLIAKQLDLVEGDSEIHKEKHASEIAERRELALAVLGEISARIQELPANERLWRFGEGYLQLVEPSGAKQNKALKTLVALAKERDGLVGLLERIDRAREIGFEPDHGEKLVLNQAKDLAEVAPAAAQGLVSGIAKRARHAQEAHEERLKTYGDRFAKAPGGALVQGGRPGGGFDQPRAPGLLPSGGRFEMFRSFGSAGPIVQAGGPGNGPEGHNPNGPPPMSEAQRTWLEARAKDNMAKVAVEVAKLKATIPAKTTPSTESRFEGAMLGLGVGDCLGSTVEFASKEAIRSQLGMNIDLVGGGPFHWLPGEGTDDSQMTVAMARAIAKTGKFDADAVTANFVDWINGMPKDAGGLTRHSLGLARAGASPEMSGMVPWVLSGYDNAGNGSVMRLAPVALLTAFASDKQLIATAKASSEITHADPRCTWGCAAICKGVALIVKGEEGVTAKVAAWLKDKSPTLAAALEAVPTLKEEDLKTTGYVVDTVQAAFWALEHKDNYVDGVLTLANNGDDTDTCAATGGVLLGAKYGKEGIPQRWLDPLRDRPELTALAKKIHQLAEAG